MIPSATVGKHVRNLSNKDPEIIKKNYASTVKRELFIIREYQDALQRILAKLLL